MPRKITLRAVDDDRSFRLLAQLKVLRGTAFDPFGYTQERRTERTADRRLRERCSTRCWRGSTPENHHLAVGLAAIPEKIRGFGHVKMRHLEAAKADEAALLEQFRAGARRSSRPRSSTMADKEYDRASEDLGNIVNLGHVNVCISDQHLATHYYITGLGLTRDPFLNTGAGNMWVNVGVSQFHLPTGTPDILRGVTGLVVPDRAALLHRLAQMRKPLAGTQFDFRESNECVETVCPWGNRINVHAPDEGRFGRIVLGMPYIRFDVRPGTAHRIARFYREVMGALATMVENGSGASARVQVGEKQYWDFCETDAPEQPYDRHHAQIYIANFSSPYRKLTSSISSPSRSTSTNIGSRISSTSTPARCCSRSSTRCAARPIRSTAAP